MHTNNSANNNANQISHNHNLQTSTDANFKDLLDNDFDKD